MKKYILFILVMLVASFQLNAQTTTTVKVSGNCNMCKGHIEKAAKEAGALNPSWDKLAKVLKFTFDASKTSTDKIEEAVAAAGYDTEHKKASTDAYHNLDECCQYDRTKQPML